MPSLARVLTTLVLGLLLALPPPAAADGVPKPRPRPHQGPVATQTTLAIPIPRLRPAPDAPGAAGERAWQAPDIREARELCSRLLADLDIVRQPLDPIGTPGGCGAPAPVLVSTIAGVALSPPATLTCGMAAALHGWITGSLRPAARQYLKTDVTAIGTATSYACRRRNNSTMGKLSEHGRANALDMSGFTFAAREAGVEVGGGKWGEGLLAALGASKRGGFLAAVRKGACGHFTTVLGPGSDPYHGDHFHVDVLARKGGYRICQ